MIAGPAKDQVNPDHYRVAGMECIDVIEALGLDYYWGTALKYIWRMGRKSEDKLTDAKKARWYIDRAIKRLEQGK